MTDKILKAIKNAAASSAMEGLPLDEEKLHIVERILNGDITLQEYFDSIKSQYKEA